MDLHSAFLILSAFKCVKVNSSGIKLYKLVWLISKPKAEISTSKMNCGMMEVNIENNIHKTNSVDGKIKWLHI